MRSSPLSAVFAVSSCLAICCLPAARGQKSYKVSTIGAELTPAEYYNYFYFARLPPRFEYKPELNAIVKVDSGGKRAGGNKAADGGGHEGQVLMPRWKAILRRLAPNLGSGPSQNPAQQPQASPAPSKGSAAQQQQQPESSAPPEGSAPPETPAAPQPGAPEPSDGWDPYAGFMPSFDSLPLFGSLPSADSLPSLDALSPLYALAERYSPSDALSGGTTPWQSLSDYWKGADSAGKGDDEPGLMASTYSAAKDVATSPIGQEAIKFALGFVPGGAQAVQAYETSSKIAGMTDKPAEIVDKVPGLR